MKKTYNGSCHCGAVRFQADIDLSSGTHKCNCSICTKKRWWNVHVKPEDFRLLTGEAELSEYQFGTKTCHHLFCRHCGVSSFIWGDVPEVGGKLYSINIACLDDVDIDELVNAPIAYFDGRHDDNWESPPQEIRHL